MCFQQSTIICYRVECQSSLVDARRPRLGEGLYCGLRAPVLGLDEEGGDEEASPVEAVRAVHRDHVQRVLLHVPLALEDEGVHLLVVELKMGFGLKL